MARVNVLMPVHNGEKYLKEAIHSIINQSFTDFSFVIIDDGSKDKTLEIINSFNDKRIKLYKNEENLGLISTLNKGLDLCDAEYIVRMDADDISMPDRIENQVQFMDQNKNVVCCGSWFVDFDEQNSNYVRYETTDNLIRIKHLYQNQIAHPTAIFRNETIKSHNLKFDYNYPHCEDCEYWTSLGQFGLLANIPKFLVRKREHQKKVSNQYEDIQFTSCKNIRIREFERIGVVISEAIFEFYTRMAYADFSFDIDEIKKLGNFLIQLVDANQKSKYINQNAFESYLSQKWFHLVYSARIKWKDKNQLITLIPAWSHNFSLYSKAKMFLKDLK